MKSAGLDHFYVLTDFDRTLTYGAVDGVKTPSIISMLRDGNHLTPDYARKAHELFEKYHPFEANLPIPFEERKSAMKEWWQKHNELLIASGLRKVDLLDIVKNGKLKFREGVSDFLDRLHEKNIPLIIISASGCGDAIAMMFEKIGKRYANIYFITNRFVWDQAGIAVRTRGEIIHSFNKDEAVIENVPEIKKIIEDRKNVLLLGDSVSDLAMLKGRSHNTILKIGFLNTHYDEDKTEYERNFDVLLEGDGDFDFVNELMSKIFEI
ncbi:MAG: haloacid dehalogenase-like hydrolase [Parcubacteria group bacterium]|nr:haloacid dehalogenase-like hydrolase [Parcubacteria group bacterium]